MSRELASDDTLLSEGELPEAERATVDIGRGSHTGRVVSDAAPEREVPSAGAPEPSECLLEDELLEYQAGQCSEAQLARLDAHLDGCAGCRELVHHLLGAEQPSGDDELSSPNGWLTTFSPGCVVNARYQIQRFVGKGGMGEVYQALDRLMGTRVALKTVICTASDRPHAVRKLMDEVRNALRVGHPNVCRINELQEHHDPQNPGAAVPFFTMEFIDGERLGDRLKQGPVPLAEVRVIAHQLLDGLKAAHARGVLHLDFKSDNVMLRRGTGAPDVVIMDFGLSRAVDRQSRQRTSERMQLAGTLPYMSLEQLECRPMLGPEADIYSFGVVLYELLTGRMPFEADTLGAMLLRQLKHRPLPPSRLVPSLSPELDRFVTRCLRSDAKERYPDAGAAMAALDAIAHWQRPRESRVRGWHLVAAAAASSLLLLAGAGVFRDADSSVDVRQRIQKSTTREEVGGSARRAPAAPPPVERVLERAPASEPPRASDAHPSEAHPSRGRTGVGKTPAAAPREREKAAHAAETARPAPMHDSPAASPSTPGDADDGARRAAATRSALERAVAQSRSSEGTDSVAPTVTGQDAWTPRAVPRALLLPPPKPTPPPSGATQASPAPPASAVPAPPAALTAPPASTPPSPPASTPPSAPVRSR